MTSLTPQFYEAKCRLSDIEDFSKAMREALHICLHIQMWWGDTPYPGNRARNIAVDASVDLYLSPYATAELRRHFDNKESLLVDGHVFAPVHTSNGDTQNGGSAKYYQLLDVKEI